jgi:AraC-like DNA-binding protein
MNKIVYPHINITAVDYLYMSQWKVPKQEMPFWRFYRLDRDGTVITYLGKKYKLRQNHVYLIPSNTDYSSENNEQFMHFYMHFFISWGYPPGIYEFMQSKALGSLLDEICSVIQSNEKVYGKIEFLAHTIVSEGLRLLPFNKFSTEVSNSMQRVVHYIRENYSKKLSNDELAQLVGMNTSAFVRKFTSHFKQSPHKFLNMVRCNRASHFMRTDHLSLDEIAEMTGFCDRYHLSRVYKSIRRISPGAYRKQML